MTIPFDRPLTFGDKDQIEAIRRLERLKEFHALPECPVCDGEAECSKCGQDCEHCEGVGKEPAAYRKFKKLNPEWRRVVL